MRCNPNLNEHCLNPVPWILKLDHQYLQGLGCELWDVREQRLWEFFGYQRSALVNLVWIVYRAKLHDDIGWLEHRILFQGWRTLELDPSTMVALKA